MSRNPQLRTTEDIQATTREFQTVDQCYAAAELDRFYHEEGLRTMVDIAERGHYSRSMYQKVYHEYFRPVGEDGQAASVVAEMLAGGDAAEETEYDRVFSAGFRAGVEFVLRNPELLRGGDGPTR